jgi:hypothetical protein
VDWRLKTREGEEGEKVPERMEVEQGAGAWGVG